jgi:hypothetical protein
MPSVGIEPTISAVEEAKTVHALDRAATVLGMASTANVISMGFYYFDGLSILFFRPISS